MKTVALNIAENTCLNRALFSQLQLNRHVAKADCSYLANGAPATLDVSVTSPLNPLTLSAVGVAVHAATIASYQ